jgi:hypothetical protein
MQRALCIGTCLSELEITPRLNIAPAVNFKTPLALCHVHITPCKPRQLSNIDTISRNHTPLICLTGVTPQKHPFRRAALNVSAIDNLDSDPITAPTTVERLKRFFIEKQQLKHLKTVGNKSSSLKTEVVEDVSKSDTASEVSDADEADIDELLF